MREAKKATPVQKPVSKTTIIPKEDNQQHKEKTLASLYDNFI